MSMRSVKQHWQHIAIILIEFNSYLHREFVSRLTELRKTEITSYNDKTQKTVHKGGSCL